MGEKIVKIVVGIIIFVFVSGICILPLLSLLLNGFEFPILQFFRTAYQNVDFMHNSISELSSNFISMLKISDFETTRTILAYIYTLICFAILLVGYRLWIKFAGVDTTRNFYIANMSAFCISSMLICMLVGCIVHKLYIPFVNGDFGASEKSNLIVYPIFIVICVGVHIATIYFNILNLGWKKGIIFTVFFELFVYFNQYGFILITIVVGINLIVFMIIKFLFGGGGFEAPSGWSASVSPKTAMSYNDRYKISGQSDYGFEYMGKSGNGKQRFYNRETGEEFYGYYSSDGRLLREDTNEEIQSE